MGFCCRNPQLLTAKVMVTILLGCVINKTLVSYPGTRNGKWSGEFTEINGFPLCLMDTSWPPEQWHTLHSKVITEEFMVRGPLWFLKIVDYVYLKNCWRPTKHHWKYCVNNINLVLPCFFIDEWKVQWYFYLFQRLWGK